LRVSRIWQTLMLLDPISTPMRFLPSPMSLASLVPLLETMDGKSPPLPKGLAESRAKMAARVAGKRRTDAHNTAHGLMNFEAECFVSGGGQQ
jgi:hypothetical protein